MKHYPLIQFSFRQYIDAAHPGEFEKAVRRASYDEFLLKSQTYNPGKKYSWFSEMVAADGRANSLHYKTGFVIEPWILKYRNQIPSLKDHEGKSIPFISHRFELIESHLSDFRQHEVSMHYQTDSYTWLETVGNAFVLCRVDSESDSEGFLSCFTLSMQPALSIIKISKPES